MIGNEALIPNGHRYTLVMISLTKHCLQGKIPANYRLEFLNHLEKMLNRSDWLTADMIAAVEPICEKGREIVREAQTLGASKALDVYANVFPTFAKLNPSLIASLDLSPLYQRRSA